MTSTRRLPPAAGRLLAVSLVLAGGSALTAEFPAVQTVAVPPGHHIALPATPYPATATDLAEVKGQYHLGDGRTLTVAGSTRRIFAEVDGRPRVELVPASPTAFVARDARMALDFDEAENGSVSGVVMTYVPLSPDEGVNRPATSVDWSAW
jgi:hypothetical protein